MSMETAFWTLLAVTVIQLLAIYASGSSIQAILKSDVFKKKMAKVNERENRKNSGGTLLALAAIILPSILFAADEAATASAGHPFDVNATPTMLSFLVLLNLVLLAVQVYFKRLSRTLVNIDKTEEELKASKAKSQINIMRVLTDAVPLDEEASIETDHEYDGIRELDNNLPPWWKWGFYLTIVIGLVYLTHFHIFKTGDLQIEAYHKEMAQAEEEIQQWLADQAMNVDEKTVIALTENSDINKGKGIFMQYCKVCHGEKGEGLVGPNLTDPYWLYGGSIKDVFKTIKYGAKNGMKSWKDELNPVQMQQVASFIKTLKGTNPENAKEAQGDLYEETIAPKPEENTSDSTAIAMN